MLHTIANLTSKLKERLIELGYELPPAASMHNNLLKQIDMDYRQMSYILTLKRFETLSENVSNVGLACTAEFMSVTSLPELLAATERIFTYVSSY